MIDAPVSIDSPAPPLDAWQGQTLITNTWKQSPSGPIISCASMAVQQDMWIDAFRSTAMTDDNDHQFLILTTDPTCGTGRTLENTDELLYGAGLGENEVDLPTGTAVHVTAAINVPNQGLQPAYLMLYDHLAEGTGSGTSSVEVHVVDQAAVQHDVDLMLAGQGFIDMPGEEPATSNCYPATGSDYQVNIVGLWPHMHESGQHVTVAINGTSILDTDYTYSNEQTYMKAATVETQENLSVTCTLQSGVTLSYDEIKPESAGGTVCWTGVYKWPTGTDPAALFMGPEECVTNSPYRWTQPQ